MATDKTHIVIDNGSDTIKAGIGGEKKPKAIFPSKVGEDSSAKFPIVRGMVTNWDDMELLWKHTFTKALGVNPAEQNVLLTEAPKTSHADKMKVAEIMFEKFQVPAIYMVNQAVLSLFATGHLAGVVVGSGYGHSHAVAVKDGYEVVSATQCLQLAGSDITSYLKDLLAKRGESVELETARDVKEKLGNVVLDYKAELQKPFTDQTHKLPDGKELHIGKELFQCTEALFQPSLTGIDGPDIHTMTNNAIQACDEDLRKGLYGNIVLSGGSAKFPGLAERMQREVTALAPGGTSVEIIAEGDHKNMAWIGGSILAALDAFQPKWITKKMYQEDGEEAIKKCP